MFTLDKDARIRTAGDHEVERRAAERASLDVERVREGKAPPWSVMLVNPAAVRRVEDLTGQARDLVAGDASVPQGARYSDGLLPSGPVTARHLADITDPDAATDPAWDKVRNEVAETRSRAQAARRILDEEVAPARQDAQLAVTSDIWSGLGELEDLPVEDRHRITAVVRAAQGRALGV